MKFLLAGLLVIWILGVVRGLTRRPPSGFAQQGPWRPAPGVEFLYDLTFTRDGRQVVEQRILATMLDEIEQAERFIVINIFLFNGIGGRQFLGDDLESPVARFTEALIAARRRRPKLPVLFISDEVNTGYGSYPEPHLERLAAHGVEVVMADLTRLPDSNPVYSGLWRSLLQWYRPGGGGRLPNIFAGDGPKMNLASYLRLLNFKANHRKMLITERAALVSSGNIHDASARHNNIAFLVRGEIVADLAVGELATARFSGLDFNLPAGALPPESPLAPDAPVPEDLGAGEPAPAENPVARHLTENAIKEALMRALVATAAGDRIWVAQFYLSQRQVMAALAAAARRGVQVRLILDPSRDAFGLDKHGIPNRSMAARLKKRGGDNLEINWFNTHGEQFHAKLTMIEFASAGKSASSANQAVIIAGSANLTRRNLNGYNLENCLEIRALTTDPAVAGVRDFFHRLWHNRDGHYLVGYEHYAEDRPLKAAWAAWQEFSGMGSF